MEFNHEKSEISSSDYLTLESEDNDNLTSDIVTPCFSLSSLASHYSYGSLYSHQEQNSDEGSTRSVSTDYKALPPQQDMRTKPFDMPFENNSNEGNICESEEYIDGAERNTETPYNLQMKEVLSLEKLLLRQLLLSLINSSIFQRMGIDAGDVKKAVADLLNFEPRKNVVVDFGPFNTFTNKLRKTNVNAPDEVNKDNLGNGERYHRNLKDFVLCSGEKKEPTIYDAVSVFFFNEEGAADMLRLATYIEMKKDTGFSIKCSRGRTKEEAVFQNVLSNEKLPSPVTCYYLCEVVKRPIFIHFGGDSPGEISLQFGYLDWSRGIHLLEYNYDFYLAYPYGISPSPDKLPIKASMAFTKRRPTLKRLPTLPQIFREFARPFYIPCNFCTSMSLTQCLHFTTLHFSALEGLKKILKTIPADFLSSELSKDLFDTKSKFLPDTLKEDFQLLKTRADGNCMFNSVSLCLFQNENLHFVLRRAVAADFLQNENEYRQIFENLGVIGEHFENLKLRIFSRREWGNSDTMLILSKIVARPIIVYSAKTAGFIGGFVKYDLSSNGEKGLPPIFIFCNKNVHFQSLIRKDNIDPQKYLNRCVSAMPQRKEMRRRVEGMKELTVVTEPITIDLVEEKHDQIFPSKFLKDDLNLSDKTSNESEHPMVSISETSSSNKDISFQKIPVDLDVDQISTASISEATTVSASSDQTFTFPENQLTEDETVAPNSANELNEKPENAFIVATVNGATMTLIQDLYEDKLVEALDLQQYSILDDRSYLDSRNLYLNIIKDEIPALKRGDVAQNIRNFVRETVSLAYWKRKIVEKKPSKKDYVSKKTFHLRNFQEKPINREMTKKVLELFGIPKPITAEYIELAEKIHGGKLQSRNQNRRDMTTERKFIGRNNDENITGRTRSGTLPHASSMVPTEEKITEKEGDKITSSKSGNSQEAPPDPTKDEKLNYKSKFNSAIKEDVYKQALSSFESEISEIIKLFHIDDDILNYTPPTSFQVVIPKIDVYKMFNFKTNRFIQKAWASVVNEHLNLVQKCCSFSAEREPIINGLSSSIFAHLYGRCGCGLRFIVSIFDPPVEGLDVLCHVKSSGKFKLIQINPTGRQMRGSERSAMCQKLLHQKAGKVFTESQTSISVHRILHNNYPQRSLGVLQVVRHEARRLGVKETNPFFSVEEFAITTHEMDTDSRYVKGYVQHRVFTEGKLQIHLYTESSLRLLSSLQKQYSTVLYFDATGSVVSKTATQGKQILLYLAMVQAGEYYFPLAEALSQQGRAIDISEMFDKIKADFVRVSQGSSKRFIDVAVVDFSFAMIHGVLRGINCMTLRDYLLLSFNVVQHKRSFDPDRCVPFVCTAHLMHSFSRLLKKHLPQNNYKNIRHIALNSLARLQECEDISSYIYVARIVIEFFDSSSVTSSREEELKLFLLNSNMSLSKPEVDTTELLRDENDNEYYCKLREASPYYQMFVLLREKLRTPAVGVNNNKCTLVVDLLQNYYIPYIPLFSAMMLKATGRHGENRLTNSLVESEFNFIKNNFHECGRTRLDVFIKTNYNYHIGRVKNVIQLAQLQHRNKIKLLKTNKYRGYDEANISETWKRKSSQKGKLKILNPRRKLLFKTLFHKPNVSIPHASIHTNLTGSNEVENETFDRSFRQEEPRTSESTTDKQGRSEILASLFGNDTSGLPDFSLTATSLATLCSPNEDVDIEQIDFYLEMLRKNCDNEIQITRPHFVCKQLNEGWISTRRDESLPMDEIGRDQDKSVRQNALTIHALMYTNHWLLLAVDRRTKQCVVYDSNAPPSWIAKSHLQEIKENALPKFLPSDTQTDVWTMRYASFMPKQRDLHSCGLYTVLAAKQIVNSKSLYCAIPTIDNPESFRFSIVREILATCENGKQILDKVKFNNAALLNAIKDHSNKYKM